MTDVTLPSLGESVTEGIITQWFKKVGDTVARDEPLFEVSTDKVDSEMPSPAAGVLTEILAEEGDTVETGSRVAVIDDSPSATPAAPSAPSTPNAPTRPDAPSAPSTPTSFEPRTGEVAPAPTSSPPPTATNDDDTVNGVVVSPVVRRILADGGVEASTLQGSGPGGSITRRDAERAVLDGPTEELVVALSNGRRRMGQHMAVSAQVTPHGFVAIEADGAVFAKLDALGRSTRDGVAITDEMLVSLAAVRALGRVRVPERHVHRRGPRRAPHGQSRTGPVGGRRRHARAGRARRGRIDPSSARPSSERTRRTRGVSSSHDRRPHGRDLHGARCTERQRLWSEPIIIQPQVAVLSVGAVREVPVVVTHEGVATVEIGRRLVLGLSFDHRVCEPVAAATLPRTSGSVTRRTRRRRRALDVAPAPPRADLLRRGQRLPAGVTPVE